MSEHKNNRTRLGGFAPRGMRGVIGVAAIAIVAFALGGLLFGGSDESSVIGHADDDHAASTSSEPTTWTCSMHPQIQLPKPGKCPICFMDLIPLDSGSGDDAGYTGLRRGRGTNGRQDSL
jgi:Cu(I)/Ag(I) efflux system membrane fusion protein